MYIIVVPADPIATRDVDLSYNTLEFSAASTDPTCDENKIEEHHFQIKGFNSSTKQSVSLLVDERPSWFKVTSESMSYV